MHFATFWAQYDALINRTAPRPALHAMLQKTYAMGALAALTHIADREPRNAMEITAALLDVHKELHKLMGDVTVEELLIMLMGEK
jgi:uncharacterized membrane protein (DUF4010 family)